MNIINNQKPARGGTLWGRLLAVSLLFLAQTGRAFEPLGTPTPLPTPKATPKPTPVPEVLPGNIVKFFVPTSSRENARVPFYVRIPAGYLRNPDHKIHRVLLSCPYYNGDGLANLLSNQEFPSVADERGWFILSPTFRQTREEVMDRKLSYFYPEKFSGKAVLDALDLIQKTYPIAQDGLLLHGFSGGAQFVHRFAIWAPDRVAAVVVNSCSWFDDPNPACQTMGWLITVGESDPNYDRTLTFVSKLKAAGALPVLRSYLAMTHERNAEVPVLDLTFLKFYDDLTREKLEGKRSLIKPPPEPMIAEGKMPWVGDSQTWLYQKNTPEALETIDGEERIYLPDESIARIWGSPDDAKK